MLKKDQQHESLDLNRRTNSANSSMLNTSPILASIATPPPILLSTSQFISQLNINSNLNGEESDEDEDYAAEEPLNAFENIPPIENEEIEEDSDSDASQPHIVNNSNLSISSLESASSQTLVQPQRSKTLNDSASVADVSKKTSHDGSKMSFTSSQSNTQAHNFNFVDPKNSNKILEGLNKLRQSGTLCDITLKIEGEEFQCHKVLKKN